MTSNHIVGTKYISSTLPISLCVLGVLAVISFVFCLPTLHAQDDSAVLYPGTYQAEDARIKLPDDAQIITVEGADGGQAVDTTRLDLKYVGTEVIVKWQGDSPVISGDCQIVQPGRTQPARDGWRYSRFQLWPVGLELVFDLHTLGTTVNIGTENPCLWVMNTSNETMRVDSITVLDSTFEMVFPFTAAVAITLGMTLFVVISALRERRSNR